MAMPLSCLTILGSRTDTDLRFAMLTSELEMASEEKSLITARRLGLEYTVQVEICFCLSLYL